MPEGKTRLALLGVLAGLTAALAGVVARRRREAGVAPPGTPGPRAAPATDAPDAPDATDAPAETAEPATYTCSCGAEYRLSGVGRHRVYWPADAPENEPVLGDACTQCGEPLPADPAGTAA